MINQRENPVAWALLLYELEDACEHLENLVHTMANDGQIDEVNFRIDMGHVYAHLNRAWNGRTEAEEVSRERWKAQSQLPTDLEPV
jgi:hypothetical protein